MEQFSHDLTLALEETSRVRAGHCWGVRRRTRSTGNLPCAPQPTEDSSSSPAEGPNEPHNCQTNSILSDSDDRQNFQLQLKTKQSCLFGNFESDSLNENFSPTRPNTRRKRKFKRTAMAEYETTPSTPGNSTTNPIFPLVGNSLKKRVIKHTNQENFRSNLLFCGKRKRSHRDRYHDYEHYRLHSSSVPRQRDFYASRCSYLEYKNRTRGSHSKSCERILPLNKSIVSKIERISQESINRDENSMTTTTATITHQQQPFVGFQFDTNCLVDRKVINEANVLPDVSNVFNRNADINSLNLIHQIPIHNQTWKMSHKSNAHDDHLKMTTKSNSFDSPYYDHSSSTDKSQQLLPGTEAKKLPTKESSNRRHRSQTNHKRKQSKRLQMKMQMNFDDPNGMDYGNFNAFLSSSSLSSSDSETAETNESDHEGDDELTDWPGNEAMVNFASKNDFKRAKQTRNVTTIRSTQMKGLKEETIGQDDDTLMSADEEVLSVTNPTNLMTKSNNPLEHGLTTSLFNSVPPTMPIKIVSKSREPNVIESEMSGETSNNFLTSPHGGFREIRAGCRRIRDERPGFSIFSSVNEHLAKFLQDSCETQLILPCTTSEENRNLIDLAKLYSLNMQVENSLAILTKTTNTTQAVKIDHNNITKFFLSDYKRRCYGAEDDSESTEMIT